MTSTSHFNLSTFAAANAAADLLDEAWQDELELEALEEVKVLPVLSSSSTSGYGRLFRVIPTVLTVAYAGFSTPAVADQTRNWRTATGRFAEATSGQQQFGLPIVTTVWDSNSFPSVSDRVISELDSISDGWAGEGSVAPSERTIQEVEAVLDMLPLHASMPSVEVDEDDGVVALRWVGTDQATSFSLVFRGAGRVTGVFATVDPPRSKSWSAEIADEIKVAAIFEQPNVSGTIAS